MNNRIYKWDNLKLFLILLVVIGHFVDVYTANSNNMKALFFTIYIFHMPLFIFISGLFSKKIVNNKNIIVKKVAYLLSLCLLLQALVFIVKFILIRSLSFSLVGSQGIQWYLFALSIFYIITYIVKNLKFGFILIIWIVLSCLSGYDQSIGDFMTISRIIVYYPFFLIGYHIKSEKLLEILERKRIVIFSAIFLVLLFLIIFKNIDSLYFLRPLLSGRNSFRSLGSYEYLGGIYRILYYPIVIFVSLAIISIIPKCKLCFTVLGKRTLQVYCLHTLILSFWVHFNVSYILQVITQKNWLKLYLLVPIVLTFILSLKIFEYPFIWFNKFISE